MGCAASFQTGLPPVQDRWGARGGERGIQGNRSRNGNGYARSFEIRPEFDRLNMPLPTPFALRMQHRRN
jgi:hypothetical protein